MKGSSEFLQFWVLGGITLVPLGILITKHWKALSPAKRLVVMSTWIGLLLVWLSLWSDRAWMKGVGGAFIFLSWVWVIREQNRLLLELEEEGDPSEADAVYQRSKFYLAIALFMMALLATIFLLKILHLI
mgnify:CR=1 FL=1